MTPPLELLASVSVGLVGGFTSGLLGISPGGGLVIFSALLLGAEQHVAQGISLIAQIPPTSISGIKRYWEKGNRSPLRWLVLLAIGFLIGGVGGAFAAGGVASSVLEWTYVFYLSALGVLLIFRPQPAGLEAKQIHWAALLAVGAIAGFSSGFLGIGGGLAITVGLSAWLRVPQHQAQLVSLALSMIPATIPAAWVYWRQGWSTSWLIIAGVVLGLWAGADLGARLANRMNQKMLRRSLIGFVFSMAVYMASKALAR